MAMSEKGKKLLASMMKSYGTKKGAPAKGKGGFEMPRGK